MGGLMGKYTKKDKKVPDKEVFSRLDEQISNLKMYQKKTEAALENDRRHAKYLLQKGKREESMTVLRRKRYREQQLRSSNAQLDKLDQITSAFELACSLNEMSRPKECKIKRGKWRSIIKRKFKKRERTSIPGTQRKLGKSVDPAAVEIEVYDVSNKKERKERDKVHARVRNGIKKQKEIDKAMAVSFKLETGDEEAVYEELEAILNGGYHLPDIDQDITNEVGTVHGSIEVSADIVC